MSISYKALVDLTLPIVSNMPIPPANVNMLPPVTFKLYKDAELDGIQVGFFQEGIHSGTHLDAPRHIFAGGETIENLPLDQFMGKAVCLDCSAVKPNEPVTAAMLEPYAPMMEPGIIALLYTGWSDKMFGTDEYWFDSPYLGEDAAQWLVDHGAKIAGFDFFQEIGAKCDHVKPDEFVVHKIILGNHCLNIEHLTNLGQLLGKEFDIIALPLRLVGAEGSPTRVVALVKE
ncbi:MAG: cyclase family protein [Clostridiales bacterium]|nr:cyclase family protein [Clostridiales bacterium]MDO4350383.1 cyclase family protein [Eubacteriales bacterium]MDY4008278.1 cyclase family protein [Candidatus Limiplasma sp.]